MRLFIAIPLDEKLKKSVTDVQASMRAAGMRGNYTPRDNLHLTLAFIGEYGDPDRVLDAMETVGFEPFRLKMDGVGRFGDLWWTGFEKSPGLDSLVRRLRRALAEADIPYDRKKFMPHVTILRRAELPGRGCLPQLQPGPSEMTVDSVCLLSSTRGRNGMIYTELGAVDGERKASYS